MSVLYIEPDKIEEFALFDEDMPHWNKIIKSGIEICVNLSESELDEKISNEIDPLYVAFNSSATMKLPVAMNKFIENLKENLDDVKDKPQGIFVLNINSDDAYKARKSYGVAVYSTENTPDNLFSQNYFIEVQKNSKINNSWKGLFKIDRPLSNSLVLCDNYFFANDDSGLNRGLSNLINFIDAFLPDELEIDYHVTIVAPNSKSKPKEWWDREYGKALMQIKKLRTYTIHLELVLAKSEIHPRKVISNYSVSKTDKGFGVFHSKNIDTIKDDNDFEYLEIFSNIDNLGTKHFQSANDLLMKLIKHCNGISEYVKTNSNSIDRSIYGCNKDKTIKNRLLN